MQLQYTIGVDGCRRYDLVNMNEMDKVTLEIIIDRFGTELCTNRINLALLGRGETKGVRVLHECIHDLIDAFEEVGPSAAQIGRDDQEQAARKDNDANN